MERPELTFTPEVADLVRKHYEAADVILEYGSGGSTVMASEMPGKTIFSVESSKLWTRQMRRWFNEAQPVSKPMMQHINIGVTGKWGSPVDTEGFQRYHFYPLSIWDTPEFKHPDVILVDGRFRVACALTAMLRCERETVLLFDDYEGRKGYHVIEDYLEKEETVGNMARFTVNKTELPRAKMTEIIGKFSSHF
ncbi:MAG: hypothetical protein WBC85_04460 [Planktotalea sp.]|uniref:hypothetical protein n=1 Tax=Planktotalea sp. TaxID=2029877 RepID=UPI003C71DA74